MRSIKICFIACFYWFTQPLDAQDRFTEEIYDDRTLRIDYFHEGNATDERFEIDNLYDYKHWAGSQDQLINPFLYGSYRHVLVKPKTGEVVFSKSFDSYFKEYQTTEEAIKGSKRLFHETALVPFPRTNLLFGIEKRNSQGEYERLFTTSIDTNEVKKPKKNKSIVIVEPVLHSINDPVVEIAIIGEGYTKKEEDKFKADLKKFSYSLKALPPFNQFKDKISIKGVLKFSKDSGCDEPRYGIQKETVVNASFNALNLERYLLVEDNKLLRDIAGHVSYDAIIVMVNHNRYGGGGIYNFYSVFTSDNELSEYVFLHEFGHSFVGLADEYYSSNTTYNGFYPDGQEPFEPNITGSKTKENLKWKHLITKDTPVPTPWRKAEYDSLHIKWQMKSTALRIKISRLRRDNTDESELNKALQEYAEASKFFIQAKKSFLENSKWKNSVGAFEGAGYASEGLFRPELNCLMFSQQMKWCAVCHESAKQTIRFYLR
jgi:hypothetical protein